MDLVERAAPPAPKRRRRAGHAGGRERGCLMREEKQRQHEAARHLGASGFRFRRHHRFVVRRSSESGSRIFILIARMWILNAKCSSCAYVVEKKTYITW